MTLRLSAVLIDGDDAEVPLAQTLMAVSDQWPIQPLAAELQRDLDAVAAVTRKDLGSPPRPSAGVE